MYQIEVERLIQPLDSTCSKALEAVNVSDVLSRLQEIKHLQIAWTRRKTIYEIHNQRHQHGSHFVHSDAVLLSPLCICCGFCTTLKNIKVEKQPHRLVTTRFFPCLQRRKLFFQQMFFQINLNKKKHHLLAVVKRQELKDMVQIEVQCFCLASREVSRFGK